MTNKVPHIYLAFAATNDLGLSLLREEENRITKILMEGDKAGLYRIYRESNADQRSIIDYLLNYREEVAIFHYSGHAAVAPIVLEDSYSKSDSIAQLLGKLPNLQLVFLNGIATFNQVERLLGEGVPAILASQVAIQDSKAIDFAEAFYQRLARGFTIKDSYQFAQAVLRTKYPEVPSIDIIEARALEKVAAQSKDGAFPWGLYLHPERSKILEWTLPGVEPQSSTPDHGPNAKLTEALATALRSFDERIDQFLIQQEKGQPIRTDQLRSAILDALPVPIAESIRPLFASTENGGPQTYSELRLQQLLQTYESFMRYLTCIQLAELRDKLWQQRPDTSFTSQLASSLSPFLKGSTADWFNFLSELSKIVSDVNETGYFFGIKSPLRQELRHGDEIAKAAGILEIMRQEVRERGLAREEVKTLCQEAETNLSRVIARLSWIFQFQLYLVKEILVHKPRGQEVRYHHQVTSLNRNTQSAIETTIEQEIFLDDHSVVLLQDPNNWQGYLSLSPFFTEQFSIRSEENLLYLFSSIDVSGQRILYENARKLNNNFLGISYIPDSEEDRHRDLIQEWNDLTNLFLGRGLNDL